MIIECTASNAGGSSCVVVHPEVKDEKPQFKYYLFPQGGLLFFTAGCVGEDRDRIMIMALKRACQCPCAHRRPGLELRSDGLGSDVRSKGLDEMPAAREHKDLGRLKGVLWERQRRRSVGAEVRSEPLIRVARHA